MKLWRGILAVVVALCAAPAFAAAPTDSPRPSLRPLLSEVLVTRAAAPSVATPAPTPLRPLPRPATGATRAPAEAAAPQVVEVSRRSSVAVSLRPPSRPENLQRRNVVAASGMRTQPAPVIIEGKRGSLCQDPSIRGERLQPIPGRIEGCGVAEPVRVTSVSGIALSRASVMDCTTARALKSWIDGGLVPAVGRLGGGVKQLQVAAHYNCRTRNNQSGRRISEHGKGRAIDISGITLQNNVTLTVQRGWNDPNHGQLMRRIHASACGPFGTVLGPKSDRFHQDHFHLDTARYRSGAYCR